MNTTLLVEEEIGLGESNFVLEEDDLRPSPGVRRILDAAGVKASDREAFWLGYHMERFVNFARRRCELLDLPIASEAYITYVATFAPTPHSDFYHSQVRQALTLFARGIERWQWVQFSESLRASLPPPSPGGWILRYRVRASGISNAEAGAKGRLLRVVRRHTWRNG